MTNIFNAGYHFLINTQYTAFVDNTVELNANFSYENNIHGKYSCTLLNGSFLSSDYLVLKGRYASKGVYETTQKYEVFPTILTPSDKMYIFVNKNNLSKIDLERNQYTSIDNDICQFDINQNYYVFVENGSLIFKYEDGNLCLMPFYPKNKFEFLLCDNSQKTIGKVNFTTLFELSDKMGEIKVFPTIQTVENKTSTFSLKMTVCESFKVQGGRIPFVSGVPTIQTKNTQKIEKKESLLLDFTQYFEKNLKNNFYTHSESLNKLKERIELFCHDSKTEEPKSPKLPLEPKKEDLKDTTTRDRKSVV